MKCYEVIIEMYNPCGGETHRDIKIEEVQISDPLEYVLRCNKNLKINKKINDDGSIVIETAEGGYIKRYTFTED